MTDPDVLLARVRELGWKVELTATGPVLVRSQEGIPKLPVKLVEHLKLNRQVLIRHLSLVALLARANGKAVWVYDSQDGRAQKVKGRRGVKPEHDRICVEGDESWTAIPKLAE